MISTPLISLWHVNTRQSIPQDFFICLQKDFTCLWACFAFLFCISIDHSYIRCRWHTLLVLQLVAPFNSIYWPGPPSSFFPLPMSSPTGSVRRSSSVQFLDLDHQQPQLQPVATACLISGNWTEPGTTSSCRSGCCTPTDSNRSHTRLVETGWHRFWHRSQPVFQYYSQWNLCTN